MNEAKNGYLRMAREAAKEGYLPVMVANGVKMYVDVSMWKGNHRKLPFATFSIEELCELEGNPTVEALKDKWAALTIVLGEVQGLMKKRVEEEVNKP